MILKIQSLSPSTEDKNLTGHEIHLIKNVWNIVKEDFYNIGFDLFIKFFTAFPDYQQKFRSFAKVPISELRGNKRVSAHANNVLYTLTGVIDSIEDSEVFVEMIEKMASNHFRRKITVDHFYNLGLVILDLFVEKLGEEIMNQECVDAWKKAYLIIIDIIKAKLENKDSDDEN